MKTENIIPKEITLFGKNSQNNNLICFNPLDISVTLESNKFLKNNSTHYSTKYLDFEGLFYDQVLKLNPTPPTMKQIQESVDIIIENAQSMKEEYSFPHPSWDIVEKMADNFLSEVRKTIVATDKTTTNAYKLALLINNKDLISKNKNTIIKNLKKIFEKEVAEGSTVLVPGNNENNAFTDIFTHNAKMYGIEALRKLALKEHLTVLTMCGAKQMYASNEETKHYFTGFATPRDFLSPTFQEELPHLQSEVPSDDRNLRKEYANLHSSGVYNSDGHSKSLQIKLANLEYFTPAYCHHNVSCYNPNTINAEDGIANDRFKNNEIISLLKDNNNKPFKTYVKQGSKYSVEEFSPSKHGLHVVIETNECGKICSFNSQNHYDIPSFGISDPTQLSDIINAIKAYNEGGMAKDFLKAVHELSQKTNFNYQMQGF